MDASPEVGLFFYFVMMGLTLVTAVVCIVMESKERKQQAYQKEKETGVMAGSRQKNRTM